MPYYFYSRDVTPDGIWYGYTMHPERLGLHGPRPASEAMETLASTEGLIEAYVVQLDARAQRLVLTDPPSRVAIVRVSESGATRLESYSYENRGNQLEELPRYEDFVRAWRSAGATTVEG